MKANTTVDELKLKISNILNNTKAYNKIQNLLEKEFRGFDMEIFASELEDEIINLIEGNSGCGFVFFKED